jgi:hypothetical protein
MHQTDIVSNNQGNFLAMDIEGNKWTCAVKYQLSSDHTNEKVGLNVTYQNVSA